MPHTIHLHSTGASSVDDVIVASCDLHCILRHDAKLASLITSSHTFDLQARGGQTNVQFKRNINSGKVHLDAESSVFRSFCGIYVKYYHHVAAVNSSLIRYREGSCVIKKDLTVRLQLEWWLSTPPCLELNGLFSTVMIVTKNTDEDCQTLRDLTADSD
ncbi:hypothetical protein BaRGS_00017820 [Batillaria attramentaria]|uniref:Uncharacterized protein n=1 Tax=Batillaria attramentaria TaxID=370345 RepID=A0ABD0KV27_9CAEN